MSKFKFQTLDVIIGVVVSLLACGVFYMNWADGLEGKLYDLRAKQRASTKFSDKVVIVGIDDDSIHRIGKYPWPRSYMANMVKSLSDSGAEVVGVDILFTDAETNPGLETVNRLAKAYQDKAAKTTIPKNDPSAARAAQAEIALAKEVAGELAKAGQDLDNDEKLAAELGFSGKAVLPMYFNEGTAIGKSGKKIPDEVEKNFIANIKADENIYTGNDFTPPFDKFTNGIKAIGHINVTPDGDSVERAVPLVVNYEGRMFPSFPVSVLRAYYKLEMNDFRYQPGELALGNAHIPVDDKGRMLVDYIDIKKFNAFRFSDVLFKDSKVPQDAFVGKIVLIGMVATGGGDQHVTPVGSNIPGVFVHASVIQGILNGSYIIRPPWGPKAEWVLMLVLALFVALAIPHLSAGKSAIIAVVLLIGILFGGYYFFVTSGYWLKVTYPSILLVAGYTVVVSKRYLYQEKRTETLEGESAETNKMLGLSFQGQGMLDMAFEKFRKVPVDDSMKDTLYNLALDFERKRQFNKAVSVYDHIMAVDKKFKDIEERAGKLKIAGETMIFGGGGLGKKSGSPDSTIMSAGAIGDLAKPQLGRYEIQKELGKGAMGIVYLGKDPKINREVAIKTLRFEDEFEPEDVKAMKERFFREAESAGRLVHPNIVTIYDAGDDGDISYIAMELLSGVDLKDFSTKEKLLPMNDTMEAIAKVAEALDYAHTQGVVHRDIKPANIMKLNDGRIKVTDFGIARITSQSKTATGTVMGTPSYMAPEQLAGKRVDGRADLFSLGVTLYEMLTGEKPFTGESMATLMYRIANEPHAPIMNYRHDLPAGVQAVIDKALKKNPDERYQHGGEMAKDLRAVVAGAKV